MSLNDQMRLLQTSWPEVLSLSLAFRSMPINGANPKLQWSSDFCMNEKEARDCGMEELFFQVLLNDSISVRTSRHTNAVVVVLSTVCSNRSAP